MMKGTLLFLGTGASTGIPVIGCTCEVCHSQNSKNKRLRTSALIQLENGGGNYLIDAGPDIRRQALHYGVDRLDGLILTHSHFDHVGGLEELRIYNFIHERALDCTLSDECFRDIQQLFYYHFHNRAATNTAKIKFNVLENHSGKTTVGNLPFAYFCYSQGGTKVTGIRIGSLAYMTDIKDYDESIFPFLRGVDTLIVSALRTRASEMHFTVNEAIEFCERTGASQCYFTHIAHEIEHEEIQAQLPDNIFLAYDGLEIPFWMDT